MGSSPRILVADDQPADVRELVTLLKERGHEVLETDNGDAAIQIAQTRLPDLMVLAAGLMGFEGVEVSRQLQSQEATAAIPLLCMVAQAESTAVPDPFDATAYSFLRKPLRAAEVVDRITMLLRLRQTEEKHARTHARLKKLGGQLVEVKSELARLNRSDPSTHLLNWKAWADAAKNEHERSIRYDRLYSILMVDVDYFKRFNDARGHDAGDACLIQVTQCLTRVCRGIDLVGRSGGGEFLILAPETKIKSVCKFGERIREAIRDLQIPHPESGVARQITASIGIAAREFGSWEDTFKRAAEALLVAKKTGRDRIYVDHYTLLVNDDHKDEAHANNLGADESKTVSRAHGNDPLILVGSVDLDDRTRCKEILLQHGCQVEEVEGGCDTLETVKQDSVDVVILGDRLANMDGLECIQKLKADPYTRDIPVIMVSSEAAEDAIAAALDAGVDEWLAKPIRGAELMLHVQSMLRLHRRHQDLLESYETRGEQARVLSVLLDFGRVIATAESLDEVLTSTIMVTADVCASRRISVMLRDGNNEVLVIAKSKGIEPDVAASVHVPVGETIVGQVFESHQATMVNSEQDASFDETLLDSPLFGGVPLVSAPLGASSQIIGVLNIADRFGKRLFKSQDLRYIDLIANIAGSAIHGLLSRQSRDQARDSIVVALAKLAEHRDNDTGRHVDRVTHYCLILAQDLRKKGKFADQIDDAFLENLERSGPLHDIGKVAIPDHILHKPGRFTPEEMEIMKPHTVIGAETIRSVIRRVPGVQFLEMAEQIAHYHHEWWDGAGYPCGLVGEQIPLAARILALADVYDALTTKRVYKEAFSHDRAVTIIVESSGTQFDPGIMEVFLEREHLFSMLANELADAPDSSPPPLALPEPTLQGALPK
ncbi:MAG: diguanylate cyclase [Phycisphaerae bacterium]|nr:diguanylate cyclase [Phycisphaerae bacterium]